MLVTPRYQSLMAMDLDSQVKLTSWLSGGSLHPFVEVFQTCTSMMMSGSCFLEEPSSPW